MRIEQLEHLIRAAAEITGDEIVVVGSQAILGALPEAPEALLEFDGSRSLPVESAG